MPSSYILTIDQGTTSSRALIFDTQAHKILGLAQREFKQYYPENGWVEHDGEEIWTTTLAVIEEALAATKCSASDVAGIGITNQRETTVVWEKATGQLVYPAIVWQDRRTADFCKNLRADGLTDSVHQRTGLYLDPYFCASKLAWILDTVPGARTRAERGELLFGTIDSFLMWRLVRDPQTLALSSKTTHEHVTDVTNASRTNLYNIHTHQWDEDLLEIFKIPRVLLPEVLPSGAFFGETHPKVLGAALPIGGVAGDQQSSLFGHGCLKMGMMKSTYGTGAFLLVHTGETPILSQNQLLTTSACHLTGMKAQYAIEGAIFIAGASLKWLKENLEFFKDYRETGELAAGLTSNENLYVVPSFSGLGTPYWNAQARGAIFGITRATTKAHIVRATLEAMAFQTHDLVQALIEDGIPPKSLRVDGGLAASDWLMKFLANILDLTITRPAILETTALGATYLAALQLGLYPNLTALTEAQASVQANPIPPHSAFTRTERTHLLKKWKQAVRAVELFAEAT